MVGKNVIKKIIGTALTALLVVPGAVISPLAEETTSPTPSTAADIYGNLMNETGSITVEMKSSEGAVGGGELTAYQAADIQTGDNGYYFSYVDGFGSGKLDNPSQPDLPKQLAEKAKSKTGTALTIGSDGKAVFNNLKTGVYLVVQTKAADGYYAVNPFLVTVPQSLDKEDASKIELNVNASPKVSLVTKVPTPTPVPNKPVPQNPTPSNQPTLAHTGLLYWPIGIMLAGGIVLCVAGFIKRGKAVRG